MSIPGRITVGLLLTQAALFCKVLVGGSSYRLWAFGGAAGTILVLFGAAAAPVAIVIGLLIKKPSVKKCGYALLVLNTLPVAILLAATNAVFRDQYRVRRADGTLRTETVEQHGGQVSSEGAPGAPPNEPSP